MLFIMFYVCFLIYSCMQIILDVKYSIYSFVDYEKAFDRVDWSILMTALKRIGVDWRSRQAT